MESTKHLKRFRGGAVFLLVMMMIVALSGLYLVFSGDAERVEIGRIALVGVAITILPILMVWNGSVFGAVALIGLLGAELALSVNASAGLSPVLLRRGLYVLLSVWMLRELIMYRRRRAEEGAPMRGSQILRLGGTGLFSVLAGLIFIGIALEAAETTPAGVLTARQIPGEQYRWMYENNILGDAERVFLYSGDSGKPYSDSGNILTDHFVGAWWREDDGKLESGWIRIGEICRVEATRTAADVKETLYTIYTFGSDSWLRILLPKENSGDKEFLARMNYLNDSRMHREVRSACAEDREPDWDRIAAGNGIRREILRYSEVHPQHLTWLRHNEFLTRHERVLNFYSHGNYSISKGGVLLTDKYFGGWSEDTDGLHSWWFKHGEICAIQKVGDTEKGSYPVYRVEGAESWFKFELPQDGGQDDRLIRQVREMNAAARTDESQKVCEAMLEEKAKKDG